MYLAASNWLAASVESALKSTRCCNTSNQLGILIPTHFDKDNDVLRNFILGSNFTVELFIRR